MHSLITGTLWTLGLHQTLIIHRQHIDRETKFAQAQAAAQRGGRGLLVVGGPYGDSKIRRLFNLRAHPCGTACADLSPDACAGCPQAKVADIRDLPYHDRQFSAVIASHILEHMPNIPDCATAYRELHRVADQVFICVPSKTSIWALLVPTHYLLVEEEGPRTIRVQERATGRVATITA